MSESEKKCANDKSEITEEAPIVTSQQLELGDQTLAYRATVGLLPLKDEKGAIAAKIFYTAYTLDADADPAVRPLIFVFNGGPGSASIWLHMGALGPKRVDMGEEGFMPPPPYKLIDNAHTWLDLGDLVFIDPVGTGYSRAADPADNEKYWGLEEDLEAVGEFIRLYLSREKRWTSPLYLAGESYGTTRAAGLAGHLIDRGIAFNGVVLISTVMNFQTLRFTKANDLPYTLYLPSFCAAAHYHGKLDEELQERDLRALLREVVDWAEADYTVALAKGDRMSADERASIAEQLSRYTGLSRRFILGADWGNPIGVALLVGAATASAIGVMAMVSALARTSEQGAVFSSIAAVVLGILGGTFFPISQAGGVLASLRFVAPHAWFLQGLGDLAGGSIGDTLPAVVALLAFTAVTSGIAVVLLRRRLHP